MDTKKQPILKINPRGLKTSPSKEVLNNSIELMHNNSFQSIADISDGQQVTLGNQPYYVWEVNLRMGFHMGFIQEYGAHIASEYAANNVKAVNKKTFMANFWKHLTDLSQVKHRKRAIPPASQEDGKIKILDFIFAINNFSGSTPCLDDDDYKSLVGQFHTNISDGENSFINSCIKAKWFNLLFNIKHVLFLHRRPIDSDAFQKLFESSKNYFRDSKYSDQQKFYLFQIFEPKQQHRLIEDKLISESILENDKIDPNVFWCKFCTIDSFDDKLNMLKKNDRLRSVITGSLAKCGAMLDSLYETDFFSGSHLDRCVLVFKYTFCFWACTADLIGLLNRTFHIIRTGSVGTISSIISQSLWRCFHKALFQHFSLDGTCHQNTPPRSMSEFKNSNQEVNITSQKRTISWFPIFFPKK